MLHVVDIAFPTEVILLFSVGAWSTMNITANGWENTCYKSDFI